MILKIKSKEKEGISWEDIDFGDVCEFLPKDSLSFYGMKVDSSLGDDMLLDLEDSKVYTDFENYKILRVIKNATLVG